jgi:hypothetical protein
VEPLEPDLSFLKNHVWFVVKEGFTVATIEALRACVLTRQWKQALLLLNLLLHTPSPPGQLMWEAGSTVLQGLLHDPLVQENATCVRRLKRGIILYLQSLTAIEDAPHLKVKYICEITMHMIQLGQVAEALDYLEPLSSQIPFCDDVNVLGLLANLAFAQCDQRSAEAQTMPWDDGFGLSQTQFSQFETGLLSGNRMESSSMGNLVKRTLDRLRSLFPLDLEYLPLHVRYLAWCSNIPAAWELLHGVQKEAQTQLNEREAANVLTACRRLATQLSLHPNFTDEHNHLISESRFNISEDTDLDDVWWEKNVRLIVQQSGEQAEAARHRFMEDFDFPCDDILKWQTLVHMLYLEVYAMSDESYTLHWI